MILVASFHIISVEVTQPITCVYHIAFYYQLILSVEKEGLFKINFCIANTDIRNKITTIS